MQTHFSIHRFIADDWLMALATGLLAFTLSRLS